MKESKYELKNWKRWKHTVVLLNNTKEQLENKKNDLYIDNNEATCKIFKRDPITSIIMLLPANNDYQPIIITSQNIGFKVIGKLALVINNRQ